MSAFRADRSALGEAELSDALFARFAQLLLTQCGISLKDYKKYLVYNRLSGLVGPGKDFDDFDAYYQALCADASGQLMSQFVNLLTTNYSFFFRDQVHFDVLRQYLGSQGRDQAYLRFWSAACSTGEEAYSVAMTLRESLGNLAAEAKILATDISTKVLSQAEEGIFTQGHVEKNVDSARISKYFEPCQDGAHYRVRESLRQLVTFRYLNLLGDYPLRRSMDVIFLRNVLIYFGPKEKEEVVNRMYDHLKPNGLLIVGLSESLVGVRHPFTMQKNSVYRK